MVDLLARFRAVGEGRVRLCIRLVDGDGQLGAAANQAFAAQREVAVLKKQQDISRDVGQAMVELVKDAPPAAARPGDWPRTAAL